MTTVVFLGPSLPVAEARDVLDAVYLPPVKQGDLVSAITRYAPTVIGLVDGEFGQTLSVWHKEILYALHRGIHVFGASSMGALRAAETDCYGTVGVGEVYRQFADGTLTDDDEVALAHGTADVGYRALSEPLVNVRATLAAAVAASVIDAALAERMVAREKAVFFPERSYPHLFRCAMDADEDPVALGRLRDFLRTSRVDLKRADALALLGIIRDLPRPLAPHAPDFELESSIYFRAMYDQDRLVHVPGVDRDVPLAAIATHAALHAADFTSINGHALDRALVDVLAEMLDVTASAEDITAERRRFCVERHLTREGALAAWTEAHHLSLDEFGTMLEQLARRRALHRWLIRRRRYAGTTRFTLDELRLRGDYAVWAVRAAEHDALLAGSATLDEGEDVATAADSDLPDETLVIEHMRATPCRMPLAYSEWAEEVGIGPQRLRADLLRARAARRLSNQQLHHLINVAET
jgi:hypothetical protein